MPVADGSPAKEATSIRLEAAFAGAARCSEQSSGPRAEFRTYG